MILSNFHEAGVDTIDWLKTFKQAYHINLRFDPIGKLKQLLIKDRIERRNQSTKTNESKRIEGGEKTFPFTCITEH